MRSTATFQPGEPRWDRWMTASRAFPGDNPQYRFRSLIEASISSVKFITTLPCHASSTAVCCHITPPAATHQWREVVSCKLRYARVPVRQIATRDLGDNVAAGNTSPLPTFAKGVRLIRISAGAAASFFMSLVSRVINSGMFISQFMVAISCYSTRQTVGLRSMPTSPPPISDAKHQTLPQNR